MLLSGLCGIRRFRGMRPQPFILQVRDAELLKHQKHRALIGEINNAVRPDFIDGRKLLHKKMSLD